MKSKHLDKKKMAAKVSALLTRSKGSDGFGSFYISTLKSLKQTVAIDGLIDTLSIPKLRRKAKDALTFITGKDFGLSPQPWRKWRSKSG